MEESKSKVVESGNGLGGMTVRKRDGSTEPVNLNKIVRAIRLASEGLTRVDPMRVATKTISGLYDGASTKELDQLSIQTSASLVTEEPEYGRLAARLLATSIDKEVRTQDIQSFSQSIKMGVDVGLIGERLANFVGQNVRKLNAAIDNDRNHLFEYFGLKTMYDRYLLRHPKTRQVIETPQQFFLRIACALSEDKVPNALELYTLFSNLDYIPSSPTLFNAGTQHEQLSSCFLLDSPQDDLRDIYKRYSDIALLSKFSGGIGVAYHRVRSRGSLIKGTNGESSGIVPWLHTLDASVLSVNQGGKRKGAACVYLETWHADIEEFLELRDNTGDEARRTHNLNIANWVPDLFMKRVEEKGDWSLFDPKIVPHFPDLYGAEFEAAYIKAEQEGLAVRTVKAQDLYGRMMRTLAQTGNGWITFKDKSNSASNQTGVPGNVIHLSNLCTEILEVTSAQETAICNLGSINLGRHVLSAGPLAEGEDVLARFDWNRLGTTVQAAVRQLDRVIDVNLYQIPEGALSNSKWRPVGLGLMGLQDVFFQLRLPFDSVQARALSQRISEEIYFWALTTSSDLAEEKGAHPAFHETRAAKGQLQFDAWGVTPHGTGPNATDADVNRWGSLRERIKKVGLRNSLMVAIAPTATIASIVGCYECIEPQVSNLFKRETMSGDFLQINKYLVEELQARRLWTDTIREQIKLAEGSVQGIDELPEDVKSVFRTAWEVPMRALIDMAAERGAFIDQSQSLNLFMAAPSIGALSSMYFYAWKKGLKTTYYLRSRPATKIAKVTAAIRPLALGKVVSESEAVSCSLENPESCEACQ